MAKTDTAPEAQTGTSEVMTREERMERQVASIPKRFNIKSLEEARALANRYTGVEGEGDEAQLVILDGFLVNDPDDKEQVARLIEAWRDLKDNRLGVTKVKKILKEEVLTVGRAIDQRERELLEILTPGEKLLKAEVDRVKELAELKKAQILEDRMLQLAEFGSNLPASVVAGVSDKGFAELLEEARAEHEAELERKRQAKAEADRLEAKRLEDEKRMADEKLRLKAEAEKLAAGQAALKKQQDELAAAQAKLDKEKADAEAAKKQADEDAAKAAAAAEVAPVPVPVPEPKPTPMPAQTASRQLLEPEPVQASDLVEVFALEADEDGQTGMPPEGAIVWSASGEEYNGPGFATEADALEDAMAEGLDGAIYLGKVHRLEAMECLQGGGYAHTMVERLLEDLGQGAWDIVGDAADAWPCASKEAEAALLEDLHAVLEKHLVRDEWRPDFYSVQEMRRVELPSNSEQGEG